MIVNNSDSYQCMILDEFQRIKDMKILSTANVSRRGLGADTDNPSVECATMIRDLSDNDRLYFVSIQKNSVLVDDDLYT